MRLFAEQDTMGALNLYAEVTDAFDDDQAFEVLRDASNRLHTQLSDVAQRIVQHQHER